MTEIEKYDYQIGDTIEIIKMDGMPMYNGKQGVITHIGTVGNLCGTWGKYAVCLGLDTIRIIAKNHKV